VLPDRLNMAHPDSFEPVIPKKFGHSVQKRMGHSEEEGSGREPADVGYSVVDAGSLLTPQVMGRSVVV